MRLTGRLFHAGAFEQSAELSRQTFGRFGVPDDAYNVACSLARMPGGAQGALSWLTKAVDAGYEDGKHIDADGDLASVRALPGYAEVRAKLAR